MRHVERIVPAELDGPELYRRNGEYVAADEYDKLLAALRRITPAYRAACSQLAAQSGDSEFWDDDAAILAECERLISK